MIVEVLVSSALVWVILQAEVRYRRWAVRDHMDALGASRPPKPTGPPPNPLTPAPPPPPPRPVTFNRHALPVTSTVIGAATTIRCYCNHRSNSYVELIDGTRECLTCWTEKMAEAEEANKEAEKR